MGVYQGTRPWGCLKFGFGRDVPPMNLKVYKYKVLKNKAVLEPQVSPDFAITWSMTS